jgi:hypothetical protein
MTALTENTKIQGISRLDRYAFASASLTSADISSQLAAKPGAGSSPQHSFWSFLS